MPDLSIETRRIAVENAAGAATLLLPRFDPTQGTLLGVRIRVDGVVTASLSLENMESRATPLAATLQAGLMLHLSSGTFLASAGGNGTMPLATSSLAAFDGTADFDGASGVQLTGLTTDFTNTGSNFDAETLAALVGTGEAELTLTGNLWLSASGGANARLLSDGDLAAAITVEYGYVPADTPVGHPGGWGFAGSVMMYNLNYSWTTYVPPPPVQITTAAQRFIFADRTTGWHDSFDVAQFDPARGTLQSVEIRLIGNIAGGAAIENHAAAATVSVHQTAGLALTWSDGAPTPLTAKAELNWNAALGAADGTDDFAGPAGWTSPGQAATGQSALTLKDNTDLARFLGTGTLALGLDSTGSGSLAATTADLLAQLQARGGAQVEVRYTYLPNDPDTVFVAAGEAATLRGNSERDSAISARNLIVYVAADDSLELDPATSTRNLTVTVAAGGTLRVTGNVVAHDITITVAPGGQLEIAGTLSAVTVTIDAQGLGGDPFTGGGELDWHDLGWLDATRATPTGNNCLVVDTRTNQTLDVLPIAYTGPASGPDHELVRISDENLNVALATDNWFIRTGDGTDAIAAHGGTNVLDAGGGSNFMTGAAGQDTFFLDARTATDDIWSTIVAFGAGDAVTIWGLAEAGTTLSWIDGQGAATATGLTLHTSVANRPAMSVTLAGYTSADLSNGRLATIFGQDPNSGSDYLYIAAV